MLINWPQKTGSPFSKSATLQSVLCNTYDLTTGCSEDRKEELLQLYICSVSGSWTIKINKNEIEWQMMNYIQYEAFWEHWKPTHPWQSGEHCIWFHYDLQHPASARFTETRKQEKHRTARILFFSKLNLQKYTLKSSFALFESLEKLHHATEMRLGWPAFTILSSFLIATKLRRKSFITLLHHVTHIISFKLPFISRGSHGNKNMIPKLNCGRAKR